VEQAACLAELKRAEDYQVPSFSSTFWLKSLAATAVNFYLPISFLAPGTLHCPIAVIAAVASTLSSMIWWQEEVGGRCAFARLLL
jgi:hypothetical protein